MSHYCHWMSKFPIFRGYCPYCEFGKVETYSAIVTQECVSHSIITNSVNASDDGHCMVTETLNFGYNYVSWLVKNSLVRVNVLLLKMKSDGGWFLKPVRE